MRRKYLLIAGILSMCLFTLACSTTETDSKLNAELEQEINTQQNIDSQESANAEVNTEMIAKGQTTEQQADNLQEETGTQETELSELEVKMEEFLADAPSEITLTQDVLRGKWAYGHILTFFNEEEELSETIRLGNVRVVTEGRSKNSYLIFSNDSFLASYEVTEARIVGDKTKSLQGVLVVSGLYRVMSEGPIDSKSYYDSKIELMITDVSFQSEVQDAQIAEELNAAIGMILQKDVSLETIGIDLSSLTEEELAEYDMELPETAIATKRGDWGYREDGSYGLTIKENTDPTPFHQMTDVWISNPYDSQLFARVARIKLKNTVDMEGKEVEPGMSLYGALCRELGGTIE